MNLKFKFLGVTWNLLPLAILVWSFLGCMLIGMSFVIDEMGGWMFPYLFAVGAYIATAQDVYKKLTSIKDE